MGRRGRVGGGELVSHRATVVLLGLTLLAPAVAAHVESGASESILAGYDMVIEKRPGHPVVGETTEVHVDTAFPGNVTYELHEDDGDVIAEGAAQKTDHGYSITHIFEVSGNYDMHITFHEGNSTLGEREVNLHAEPGGPSPVFWAYVLLFVLSPIVLVKLKNG